MIKTRNRYVIASAGITLHLMIGGVYAWSVFTGPIVKQTGWAEASVSFVFSLAIFFLGMSAAFMGRLVEKFGPTITECLLRFGCLFNWDCNQQPTTMATLLSLWCNRQIRPWSRLRNSCFYNYPLVSGQAWPSYRFSHHGLWLCGFIDGSDCSNSNGKFWCFQHFLYFGYLLFSGHDYSCPIY